MGRDGKCYKMLSPCSWYCSMAILVHCPNTVLKRDRTRDQGNTDVDCVLKWTRGNQAVERSGMPYFFYLAEWLGVSCSCWRFPFAAVLRAAPCSCWSSNCSLHLWSGSLRLFGKLIGEKSFWSISSIFLLQKKAVTLGLYVSPDLLLLFSYSLLSRLWCNIKAQRKKTLWFFTFSVLVILKLSSLSCILPVMTFQGILCWLLAVWKVVGSCLCFHSAVLHLMSDCVTVRCGLWERRSQLPHRDGEEERKQSEMGEGESCWLWKHASVTYQPHWLRQAKVSSQQGS